MYASTKFLSLSLSLPFGFCPVLSSSPIHCHTRRDPFVSADYTDMYEPAEPERKLSSFIPRYFRERCNPGAGPLQDGCGQMITRCRRLRKKEREPQ